MKAAHTVIALGRARLMKRIAEPMVGGLFTSFILERLVYPAVFLLWKQRAIPLSSGHTQGG